MLDDHLRIFEIPLEEFMESSYGYGRIPLPQLAPWRSLPPTATPSLDNVAALPVWGTSTDQTDSPSLPNGQLFLPTATGAPDVGQTAPTTKPTPPHFSHTTSFHPSDSSTAFTISLLKPRPTQSSAVILPRIETHVYLDIGLPSGPWNAIQLPCTKSVTSNNSSFFGEGIKPLLLVITVRGATTRQEYSCVCEQCEKRMGNKMGPPSLIDFHGPSNILTARRGMVQVHFTFSCYSRHHRKEDKQYVLEVILKDPSNPEEPIEVARKKLPYSFDVRSSRPRIKEPTSDQTQRTNISPPPNIRRGAKQVGPIATPPRPPPAQLAAGPHSESIEGQIQQEQLAGEVADREPAGQRTNGHVPSIGEPNQQSPSDLQRLPSAIPVFHPFGVPKPTLLVQPRRGSSGGEDRDSLEGDQGSVITMRSQDTLGINTARPASDAGAQYTSDGIIHKGQSYSAPDIFRQQKPSPFALVHPLSFQLPHIPTNTEMVQTRAKIAEREVQIQALECYLGGAESQEKFARLQPIMDRLNTRIIDIRKEIADRLDAFSAERQEAEAAVKGKVADLEAQIRTLKQENSYTASVLTTMANTTKSHRSA